MGESETMKVLNEDLMVKMLDPQNLEAAWKAVESNDGSAGMDGIGIDAFVEHMRLYWHKVHAKLNEGRYKPAAVKREYIPKGKQRALAIPTVLQQTILQVLQPVFEPTFSEHS